MARKRKRIKVVLKKLGNSKAWGLAFQGEDTIHVDFRCKPKFFCQVLNHEVAHLHFPEISETRIDKFGRDLANILYEHGFRRIYDDNKRMAPHPTKSNKGR